jgi:DNA-binding XRE family transcriptional regulator
MTHSEPIDPAVARASSAEYSEAAKSGASPERLWRDLVGEQLRAMRRSRGESLQHVAERARVSPQYLSEIERGGKEPSSEILAAVVGALESDLLDLTSRVAGALHRGGSATRGSVQLAA